jgi:6-phosphogluconolactonase
VRALLIFSFPDYEHLSAAAADAILRAADESIRKRGIFTLALSGGNTPRRVYELLASAPRASRMPWSRTHFFWGDERCVPPDDASSNYRMAGKTLLSRSPVPVENIHRIPGEQEPSEAALTYENLLRDFFLPQQEKKNYLLTFDCILLGMGADGHTASLFPGNKALDEREKWVVPVQAPEGIIPRSRITLTLPVINLSESVIFLVSGEGKKEAVGRALYDLAAANEMPAAMVKPKREPDWYLDFKI